MTRFAVRGWCPDAWRPMMAGDGLLVRVRPRLGRLSRHQLLGLCNAADAYGNGAIDVTSRANLQIRGVTEQGWRALAERLVALDLVDVDLAREARSAIMVAPAWQLHDDTHRIATTLLARRDDLPALPGKIGMVIDAGAAPMLSDNPGDFRIERGVTGRLILRADGRPTGIALAAGEEAETLIALAEWFVASGGSDAGRMTRHRAPLPAWASGIEFPAPPLIPIHPGPHSLGMALGVPFGRSHAQTLAAYLEQSGAVAMRVTPWRILIAEAVTNAEATGFITHESPLIRADACVGAPACPQASVETRDLARRLAPHVDGGLHVAGCAKGCARATPADVVLTGRDGRYDLVRAGRAGDAPRQTGLDADQILAQFGTA